MTASGYDPPDTITHALGLVADWMDEADRVITRAFLAEGKERSNQGDDVQRDLRRLAQWFVIHPHQAASAWAYVTEAHR